jgi:hypothetical protein
MAENAFWKRRFSRGNILLVAGLMIFGLMIGALALDTGLFIVGQGLLQTQSDAAALAAAETLFTSEASEANRRREEATEDAQEYASENPSLNAISETQVSFGYVDPLLRRFRLDDWDNPPEADDTLSLTGGANAVRVKVLAENDSLNSSPLPSVLSRLVGLHAFSAASQSLVLLDTRIASVHGGMRPINLCQQQIDLAMADGDPSENVIRVYPRKFYVDGVTNLKGCPPSGEGLWGLANFQGGSLGVAPSVDATARWLADGYPGTVAFDQFYNTQDGQFLSQGVTQETLRKLIASQRPLLVPVISGSRNGVGDRTQVHVTGVAAMILTGFNGVGPLEDRYVEGHLTRMVCRDECQLQSLQQVIRQFRGKTAEYQSDLAESRVDAEPDERFAPALDGLVAKVRLIVQ